MKTIVVLLCSFLVLSVGVLLPNSCEADSLAAQREKTDRLFEQIRDLDLVQRNIEACYQAERRYNETGVAPRVGRVDAELDAGLLHRVFSHLSGYPEYGRFVAAHHSLMQLPEFRRRHADELFTEYVRLLEAARVRLLSQVKVPEEASAGEIALAEAKGLNRSKPVEKVLVSQDDDTGPSGRGKVVPAVLVNVEEAPLNRMLLDTGPACMTTTTALRPESGGVSINLPGTGRSIPSNQIAYLRLIVMEDCYEKYRRRKNWLDIALGSGGSYPGLVDTVSPARLHVRIHAQEGIAALGRLADVRAVRPLPCA